MPRNNNESGFFCTGAEDIIKRIAANRSDYKRARLDTFTLSSQQAHELASALQKNNTLEYLDLTDCMMEPSDYKQVLAALEKNTSIKTLKIHRDVGKDLYQQFKSAVPNNGL